MYSETVKSTIKPLITTVIWALATYAFTIVWGIAQILFEFEAKTAVQIICLISTALYAWFLITRLLSEYEFSVFEQKFTVTKVLSKRASTVALVAVPNIRAICTSKQETQKYDVRKYRSFVLPRQKENEVYVVYKDKGYTEAIRIRVSQKLVDTLKNARRECGVQEGNTK